MITEGVEGTVVLRVIRRILLALTPLQFTDFTRKVSVTYALPKVTTTNVSGIVIAVEDPFTNAFFGGVHV